MEQIKETKKNNASSMGTTMLVLEFALSFGFTLVIPIVLGLFIGLKLDAHFDSGRLWTIICLFLGVLFGTLAAFNTLQKVLKRLK